ncbi:ATP-binding protein [uncultured Arcticibacterium sp.]|uniref:GAF domain-containing sensor histidine kinase n=1 Tax=uncultured Arcticibacterium sp. TaxID=2173042 RepID=UPI0030FC9FAC
MQIANLPANEKERLQALTELEIIGSEEEESFNDLAKLASYVCGTPVALISFIEEDRQWFKSAVGTDLRETPRDIAFCSHAILEEENFMMVSDAKKDVRFVNNPLVTGETDIQFYAGVPLRVNDQLPVGTVCVLDTKPHKLSLEQEEALRRISRQVMQLLELRKTNIKNRDLAVENENKLKEEIERQTESLERKNFELRQLNSEMEQMVYIASHDLKEPIRKLKIYADILGEETFQNAKINKFLPKIHNSTDRAYNLVNDILDFAKVKSIGLLKEDVDFNELMQAVIEASDEIISDSKAQIEINKLPTVKVDKGQMIQLFSNLIQNAIKYCKNVPTIKIEASTVVLNANDFVPKKINTGTFYKIDVTDNGIGFDLSHKDKIFDFFQRLHNRNEFSGTGIGLAIVKKIAQNHGGLVEATSQMGEGSVFSVYLPV